MTIPLVDLSWQHQQIQSEVAQGFTSVIEQSDFILGSQLSQFEHEFADFCGGAAHCVGVGNGTDAIELALRSLGVGLGDEVVVPANTFIATALAVIRAGATPVLVDCDRLTHLIDIPSAARAVTEKTKAVVAVHLYGRAVNIELLRAALGSVPIVEDAAQAHGARSGEHAVGAMGDVAAFSFYPGKNLGCYGDGGAIVTQREGIAQALRGLRNWGSVEKYHHPVIGFNSRLDTLQAVVLRAKLRRLDDWNEMRASLAAMYAERLAGVPGVETPEIPTDRLEHVWHLYVVRVQRRDEVLGRMQADGIGVGVHYPVPLHLQGALRDLGYPSSSFPNAEAAASSILSLPIFPGMTESQIDTVCRSLEGALTKA